LHVNPYSVHALVWLYDCYDVLLLLELLHIIVVDGQDGSSVAHITPRVSLLFSAH